MIFTMSPENERNFETLIDMINYSECREEDETFKNVIDKEFEFVDAWINNSFTDDMDLSKDYRKESVLSLSSSTRLTNWQPERLQNPF